jgi:Putative zinc-finger
MAESERCAQVRELAAELALGIADGEDRALVLEHAASCADCRRELEGLSGVADDLLALTPEEEPPLGFELRVLHALEPSAPGRARPWHRLALAAAVLLTAALTAGVMLIGFRDDRQLADQYRAALEHAHGYYFGASELRDAGGRPAGAVFAYGGDPSWMTIAVDPAFRGTVEEAELVTGDGGRIPLRSFRLENGVWGGALPVGPRELAAVHLVDRDGRSILFADLPG